MNLFDMLRAGLVLRWHSNPDMFHVVDPIEAHNGRVARLIAYMWPDASAALLKAALRHDDGEIATGDWSATFKRKFPEVAKYGSLVEAEKRQEIWGPDIDLSALDADRLDFADKLDAYLTAQRHASHVLDGDGWPDQRAWLLGRAHALGVAHHVEGRL